MTTNTATATHTNPVEMYCDLGFLPGDEADKVWLNGYDAYMPISGGRFLTADYFEDQIALRILDHRGWIETEIKVAACDYEVYDMDALAFASIVRAWSA